MKIFPKVPDLLINQTKTTSKQKKHIRKQNFFLKKTANEPRGFLTKTENKSIYQISKDKRPMNFESKN